MAQKEDKNFNPSKQVTRLKQSTDYLAGYNIKSCFSDLYTLMFNLV
jgi:hypothetical protein